jgi:thioredoxin reductase (NADPH)
MTELPGVLVVDQDDRARSALVEELRRRYGADYDVVDAAYPTEALEHVRKVRLGGGHIALALADVRTGDAVGFMATLRTLDPLAKRLLLMSGDRPDDGPLVQRAAVLGQVDHFVAKPRARRDEQFHATVTDFLRSWGREDPDRYTMVRIVGEQWDPRAHELLDLLDRGSVPYRFLTPDTAEGRALITSRERLPVAVLTDGTVLVDPSREDIAERFGGSVPDDVADLAIVGGGPAGLAAAVYAASEGLDTVIFDHDVMGGQAGTSSRIRNYLGFPQGVLGADLARRAMEQAWIFGVRWVLLHDVTALEPGERLHRLRLSDGQALQTRAVLLAGGASYRRLGVPELEDLVGAGVFYGSGGSQASAMAGADVYVAGGGNSAGQAAVNLARHAKTATLLVRGDALAANMSEYLIDEIDQTANIAVRLRTQVVGGGGTGRLEWLRLQDRAIGTIEDVATPGLFILIGAVPHTAWLPDEVLLDDYGYVLTPRHMETSVARVFAAGDIRAQSMKRVASAVGEGATAVAQIHQHLRWS